MTLNEHRGHIDTKIIDLLKENLITKEKILLLNGYMLTPALTHNHIELKSDSVLFNHYIL